MTIFRQIIFFALLAQSLSAQDRPNIILMMADDLGWNDPSYNSGWINTPTLDTMAAEGLRFDRFYSASAVCSPTRGSCLTGRNPIRLGIPNANTGRLEADETPLSEILNKVGYATGHFGKWHLGTLTTLRNDSNRGSFGHTANYSPPWQHGYDYTFATEAKVPTFHPMRKTVNGLPEPTSFSDPNFYGTRYWTAPADINALEGVAVGVTDNLSGDDSRVIMDRVIPFIRDAVTNEEPFFTVIWFHTPHKPLPDPAGLTGVDSNDAYTDAIVNMDTQIARLRAELNTLGVNDNTMFWFCSDNGPEDGVGSAAPYRERKRSLHEGGVRVPGILVWPDKIPVPRATAFPAVTSDYYPTIVDFLELEVPDQKPLDGISLRGVIENTVTERAQPIGFQYLAGRSWVSQQYKLISKDSGSTFELYDLLADPSETTNIAASLPDVVAQMTSEYQTWAAAVASDIEYVPPGDLVTATLSTPGTVVAGLFEVTVAFNENVSGLEEADFSVTNASIDSLSGAGSSYVLALTPIVEGLVSIQLPVDSVVDDEDNANTASNILEVLFTTAESPVEGSVILDDHFKNDDPSGWISQGNAIAANHAITEALSSIQSTVTALASNSNRGIASSLSFDPSAKDGFSLTFVVDEVAQAPEVNGYFLGVVGDNSVFYRESSTRNFGLTFFGTESRTDSLNGFGLNFGDNFGATGAEVRLFDGDVQLDSFLDGFTATMEANPLGWRLTLNGLASAAGVPIFIAESGTWSEAGTSFEALFGNDDSWYVVTSNQRLATGVHSTSFDRIRLVSGVEPVPEITRVDSGSQPGELTIHWRSVEGYRYRIDRSDDLESWVEIGVVDSIGSEASFTDTAGNQGRLFYRLVRL